MTESVKITKIFEILSQPIRLNIVRQLNVQQRQFSQILDNFDDIKSNKLSFHIKKLIETELITKKGDYYQLTEFGYQTLHFIEAFETGQLEEYRSDLESDEDIMKGPFESILKKDLSDIPQSYRISGLPLEVQTFELYLGKNAKYLYEKYILPLPDPIDTKILPKEWINNFKRPLTQLMSDSFSSVWLKDRMLKYAYGTRGLFDYGLMDASLAVPPLQSTISTLQDLLIQRGKAGLFAKTGMGKSRIILYLASWWYRKFGSPVLFVDNPSEMAESEWLQLIDGLINIIQTKSQKSPLLLIIEDVQLVKKENLFLLKKLIGKSSRSSFSILISATISDLVLSLSISKDEDQTSFDQIKQDLQPLEITEYLDLSLQWSQWKPYFIEWIQWVVLDILVDIIPWHDATLTKRSVQFESPWSLVVSIGFLRLALGNLQKSVKDNSFPLVLYALLANLYLIRGEQPIEEKKLLLFLSLFSGDIKEVYSTDWKSKIIKLINEWSSPFNRLLPPLKYAQKDGKLKKEPLITFYHQKWALEVGNILKDKEFEHVRNLTENFFTKSLPSLKYFWNRINESIEVKLDFMTWLRENCLFKINSQGYLLLVHLKINDKYFRNIDKNFKLPPIQFKEFSNFEMLNWSFIKSVITSYHQLN